MKRTKEMSWKQIVIGLGWMMMTSLSGATAYAKTLEPKNEWGLLADCRTIINGNYNNAARVTMQAAHVAVIKRANSYITYEYPLYPGSLIDSISTPELRGFFALSMECHQCGHHKVQETEGHLTIQETTHGDGATSTRAVLDKESMQLRITHNKLGWFGVETREADVVFQCE